MPATGNVHGKEDKLNSERSVMDLHLSFGAIKRGSIPTLATIIL